MALSANQKMKTNVLFICSKNKWRSPTAEAVFCNQPKISVRSAGLSQDAEVPLSTEDVEWAEIIFVMESKHKRKLSQQFKHNIKDQRVVCLDIPDNYQYMDERLIEIFKQRVPKFLP